MNTGVILSDQRESKTAPAGACKRATARRAALSESQSVLFAMQGIARHFVPQGKRVLRLRYAPLRTTCSFVTAYESRGKKESPLG